jgi:putative transposase
MFHEHRRRKQLRLLGYDYSQPGLYYITMVTQDRLHLFGNIRQGEMFLSTFGHLAKRHWRYLPYRYPGIRMDEFVVMPDHIHGIIAIAVGAGFTDLAKPAPTPRALSEIIRGFKTSSAISINDDRQTPGRPVWQRNYYERIIRNQMELERTRQYIRDNPKSWVET